MTYAATRSSVLERAKRKENGERSTLANRCIARLYPWRREAEIDGGPLLREGCSRGRRRRRRGDDRHLDRAEAGGALGRDDYLFEGYELDDALDAANGALEDDVTVSESDGRSENLKPFTRGELLKPLERWFFGRR
jgi:hypothetical protein